MILGIELGSTRIKSVLMETTGSVLASGSFEWENKYENGYWTYSLDEVRLGLQASYRNLLAAYGKPITNLSAIGVSAMMHGYLAFDKNWKLLTPFRTWRNTSTKEASLKLTKEFDFHIPERYSVAHFYQAILDHEEHVSKVAHLTTLAGYVHFLLTGKNVLGVGDASGMFPIDKNDYNLTMLDKFYSLTSIHLKPLLPKVLVAGVPAGYLTRQGALYLDPTGTLKEGVVCCPPEGDAGTGMVATNSILPRTANVSAGTSAFLMAVLEKPLSKAYPEIDIVTTPIGDTVAMVHVNNCTSEINAWVELFEEVIELAGGKMDRGTLITKLFLRSMETKKIDGLVGYNFLSGEPLADILEGNPMIIRKPEVSLNLANFMRLQIFSSIATLSLGTEILNSEGVFLDTVCGHGGFFKTNKVGQLVMSAALGSPVTVMKNAGEGGAWGIALLAGYVLQSQKSLSSYLDELFQGIEKNTLATDDKLKEEFDSFMVEYKKFLPVVRLASKTKR